MMMMMMMMMMMSCFLTREEKTRREDEKRKMKSSCRPSNTNNQPQPHIGLPVSWKSLGAITDTRTRARGYAISSHAYIQCVGCHTHGDQILSSFAQQPTTNTTTAHLGTGVSGHLEKKKKKIESFFAVLSFPFLHCKRQHNNNNQDEDGWQRNISCFLSCSTVGARYQVHGGRTDGRADVREKWTTEILIFFLFSLWSSMSEKTT
ncbi:hypothetical protein JOL62DRAFT_73382 [Phyllosticta paracitricarpa]